MNSQNILIGIIAVYFTLLLVSCVYVGGPVGLAHIIISLLNMILLIFVYYPVLIFPPIIFLIYLVIKLRGNKKAGGGV